MRILISICAIFLMAGFLFKWKLGSGHANVEGTCISVCKRWCESDDAGSEIVSEITGTDFKPWSTPVMETLIGGEISGEVESLLFCVQTGIVVGIIFFFLERFVERTKKENLEKTN